METCAGNTEIFCAGALPVWGTKSARLLISKSENSHDCRVCFIVGAKLATYALDINLDRFFGDAKNLGDVVAISSTGRMCKNFELQAADIVLERSEKDTAPIIDNKVLLPVKKLTPREKVLFA